MKPGDNIGINLLNVLTSGGGKSGGQIKHRYVVDPLGTGPGVVEYYTDKDLAIGTCIDCYGRKIVLTGCDNFTKEYYNVKFGIGMNTSKKAQFYYKCQVGCNCWLLFIPMIL